MKREKTTKCVRKYFRYMECDAFAEYLHEMSLQGWHFTGWKMGLRFERGEPEDVCYSVEVLDKATEMDLQPEEDAAEFSEYCKAAGWQLIDGTRKFSVYRRREADAPPIMTEEERFRNIRKAEWRQFLSSFFGVFLIVVVNFCNWFSRPEDLLFHPIMLDTMLLMSVLFLMDVIQCGILLCWSIVGAKRIRQGNQMRYGRKLFDRWLKGMAIVLGAAYALRLIFRMDYEYVFIFFAVFGLTVGVAAFVSWLRPSRSTNWIIQIGIGIAGTFLLMILWVMIIISGDPAQDEEAGTQEEIRWEQDGVVVTLNEDERLENDTGSLMIGVMEIGDGENMDTFFSIRVSRTEAPFLRNMIWRQKSRRTVASPEEAERWLAQEALVDEKRGWVYLKYEDTIASLRLYGELDEQDYAAAAEALRSVR